MRETSADDPKVINRKPVYFTEDDADILESLWWNYYEHQNSLYFSIYNEINSSVEYIEINEVDCNTIQNIKDGILKDGKNVFYFINEFEVGWDHKEWEAHEEYVNEKENEEDNRSEVEILIEDFWKNEYDDDLREKMRLLESKINFLTDLSDKILKIGYLTVYIFNAERIKFIKDYLVIDWDIYENFEKIEWIDWDTFEIINTEYTKDKN